MDKPYLRGYMADMIIKKSHVLFICVIALTLIYFVGCKKNNAPATFQDNSATIVYAGAVAADGCGYLVRINNVSYHADNLGDAFNIDKLNVVVSADVTSEKYQCGISPANIYPVIHIIAISKQ